MKKGNHNVALIILLTLVLLIGGTGLALLIYLDATGTLGSYLETFFAYVSYGANGAIIICWGIVLPVVLVAFLIFTLVRRNKINKLQWNWEKGLKQAIEAERADFAAKQNRTLVSRFSPLKKGETVGNVQVSLSEFCDAFARFAAANLGLYFSSRDVRRFVAALGTSRMLILQGISGSGKTSLAYAFGEFIGNPSTVIPVQPMWKERSDLLGYYNEFTRHFNETTLFRKLYEANFGNKMYVTVLDEMNIARIEYYFAEFLSLMELPDPELRQLEIVSDVWDTDPEGICEGRLHLPQNMWFVGTVNNDDSAYAVSDKVYDRAMVIDLSGRAEPFDVNAKQSPVCMSFDKFESLTNAAKNYVLSEKAQTNLKALDDYLIEKFQLTFGNRIRRQINDYTAVYVACGGTETEALDDILSKKVLRKLEYKDITRRSATDLVKFIRDVFGKMPLCERYLNGLATE